MVKEKQENLLFNNFYTKLINIALFLGLHFYGFSQDPENLVLNPSFEEIDTCLPRLSVFGWEGNDYNDHIMKYWRTLVKYSSPGYCSDCFNPSIGNPCYYPHTPFGYQVPRTGNNFLYMGNFQQDVNFNYRTFGALQEEPHIFKESLTGTFKTALLENKTYYLEFYANQVNILPQNFGIQTIATDAFDIILHSDTNYIPRAEPPYINQNDIVWSNTAGNVIEDTLNWVKLSGCFRAKGGEKYFTIGTFRDTTKINNIYYYSGNNDYSASYFYDDFLIYQCDTCCPDQYPVEDYITVNNNLITQGETATFETFLNEGHTANLYLFDSAGRIVYQAKLNGTDNSHQIPNNLAAGVYHYAMVTSEKKKLGGKIVVIN